MGAFGRAVDSADGLRLCPGEIATRTCANCMMCEALCSAYLLGSTSFCAFTSAFAQEDASGTRLQTFQRPVTNVLAWGLHEGQYVLRSSQGVHTLSTAVYDARAP